MRAVLLALIATACAHTAPAPSSRNVHKEVIVRGAPADLWRSWTTAEGLGAMLGVPANVRLEPGGPYEIFWVPDAPEGQRGSDGCTVVSFVPERSITFTWNAPPSFGALREELTQVTVTLEPLGAEHVRVRLVQEGFGPGPERDALLVYFDRAWEHVMAAVRKAHP